MSVSRTLPVVLEIAVPRLDKSSESEFIEFVWRHDPPEARPNKLPQRIVVAIFFVAIIHEYIMECMMMFSM